MNPILLMKVCVMLLDQKIRNLIAQFESDFETKLPLLKEELKMIAVQKQALTDQLKELKLKVDEQNTKQKVTETYS